MSALASRLQFFERALSSASRSARGRAHSADYKPDLAARVMAKQLEKISATHVTVEVTSQDTPCATVSL
jgi:hypothetical protein